METLATLASAMEAFITEEQLEFEGKAVQDMQRVGRYIKSLRHLWEPILDANEDNGLTVQGLRVGNPQVVLITVPAGASIPIHQHGPKVFGVSGLIAGDLIEVGYEVEDGRLHARSYSRLTVYHGIGYQDVGLHHAVANIEKSEPALIVECWMPKLEFTPLRLVGRTVKAAHAG